MDVAYDLWFGHNEEPNPLAPSVSVMIWLNWLNLQPLGSYQTTVTVWNEQWDLW